jgi:hypothetical protein
VFLAAHLLAPRLPQIPPFFRSRPLHVPEDTPPSRAPQARKATWPFSFQSFQDSLEILSALKGKIASLAFPQSHRKS